MPSERLVEELRVDEHPTLVGRSVRASAFRFKEEVEKYLTGESEASD